LWGALAPNPVMPMKIPSSPMIGMGGPVRQPPKGLYHRITYVLLKVAL
jgi:hypothetical protein